MSGVSFDIRKEGVGTSSLAVALVVVFVVGTLGGYYLNSSFGGADSTLQDGGGELELLRSRVENLERKIDLLGVSSGSGAWNVENVYRMVRPSVVEIASKTVQEDIFGTSESWAYGSGFVYREDGLLFTNAHVVQGADRVLVTFANGETVEAEIRAHDVFSDIAVLEVDPSELDMELEPLPLENSTRISPGDKVLAVGSPYRLSGTITTGIVSQVDRTLTPGTINRPYPIPGVIQIDAAINPGNSGGPLLTMEGKLVGINTAIQSSSGEFSGIGFAISSNLVRRVASDLVENGVYHHPWIGVTGVDVNARVLDERNLARDWGYIIAEIQSDSPASRSDLKTDDLIIGVDDRKVKSMEDILSYIELNHSPGDEVEFRVLRDGEEMEIPVTLGKRPSAE